MMKGESKKNDAAPAYAIINTHYKNTNSDQDFVEISNNISLKSYKMSSREIADLTGKRHADILLAIRKMEHAWEKISQRKFAFANYVDEQGKQRPMYILTKTECLYISTKFNDEARAKLVLRWEELEIKRIQSQPIAIADKRIKELEAKVEENKPKIQFADSISGTTKSIDVETFAKVLYDEVGISKGRNSLMQWFRDNKYLNSDNIPYQWVLDQKYMKLKEGTFKKPGHKKAFIYTQPLITGKGQLYFVNKLMNLNQLSIIK